MARHKKPFTLYPRPAKGGTKVFYVQFRDEHGKRLTAVTSGKFNRAEAETWAIEQIKNGDVKTSNKDLLTFKAYFKDFFIYDICPYIQEKLARGLTLGKKYASDMRRVLDKDIMPYFGGFILNEITVRMVTEYAIQLNKQGMGKAKINRVVCALKILFGFAEKMDAITRDPARRLGWIPESIAYKRRGVLTPEEFRTLFSPKQFLTAWQGRLDTYTINLLSASTGMRIGEVLGVQIRAVHDGYIEVNHSWDRSFHELKTPKSGKPRFVVLYSKIEKYLRECMDGLEYQDPEDLVFCGNQRGVPISNITVLNSFYFALDKIGIKEAQRKQRRIVFHSHRHFYVSWNRGKMDSSKLQFLTGHADEKMQDVYTHFQPGDFTDAVKLQEQLFIDKN